MYFMKAELPKKWNGFHLFAREKTAVVPSDHSNAQGVRERERERERERG